MAALMQIRAAAETLGICERQLRKLISSGEVAAINVGTGERPSWRFHPSDIDDFIARRRRIQWQQSSEGITGTRSKASTPTTSEFEVIDFEARWKQQTAAKQSATSRTSAKKQRPRSRSSQGQSR